MTRTERASYPRALNKDRSVSRNNMDKSMKKGGASGHNWGAVVDQHEIEFFEEQEGVAPAAARSGPVAERVQLQDTDINGDEALKPAGRRTSVSSASSASNLTEEELKKALAYRTNAMKNGKVDLAQIARTSGAISTSPPK